MCLSVYANGVGSGAGTHVSVGIILLRGELDAQLKWPMTCPFLISTVQNVVHVCPYSYCQLAANEEEKEVDRGERLFDVVSCRQRLVNDCLTIQLKSSRNCYVVVSVV